MKIASPRSSLSWIIAAALLGLLAILGTYQYRWLGEVSEAQRERTRTRLERDAHLFGREFNRELTRIFAYVRTMAPSYKMDAGAAVLDTSRFPAFFELWDEVAPFPEFLRDVLYADREPSGKLELARYDPETAELREMPWPTELKDLKQRLEELPWAIPPDDERPWNVLDGEASAVVVPLFAGRPQHRRPPWEGFASTDEQERRGRFSRDSAFRGDSAFSRGPAVRGLRGRSLRDQVLVHPPGFLIFHLDAPPLLSKLAARHFGAGGALELHLRVVDQQDPARVIFEAGPQIEGDASKPLTEDAHSELFGFGEPGDARQLIADLPLDPDLHRERWIPMLLSTIQHHEDRWRLVVTHPSGSLEAAVSSTRQRNLAIGLGILLVLGTSILLLLVTTRRAQKLARQQIEFVASVTHELRTPLAAMRSAGENLADGVVRDPAQVERYGTLISAEGRRLSEMVEQVLEYAGIQSGRRRYQQQRTSVSELIRDVLAESRPVLLEKGFEVETQVEDDLPSVLADPAALHRALGNLVGNAIKYGEREAWIAIRARRAGNRVRIRVEDHGQGIDPQDLPHIFEPFYRGRDLSAGRIPGSGLGLSLVRQICETQGGRVSVSSQAGQGSVFTLHLPAAPAAEDEGLRVETCEA